MSKQQREEFLRGRHIATLATENADGSVHLVAVWYLYEDGCFYVDTESRSQKAQNARARSRASIMVDSRSPGTERGVTAMGRVEVLEGVAAQAINRRVEARYLSEAALKDPAVGPVFAQLGDVTLRLTPERWVSWDLSVMDAEVFGGKLGSTPSYLLPLD
jgi:PPOX class probable F420-dependent enzyme